MVHGVLLINKTKGGTSHSVVTALRRIIQQKEIGHAGTLDPMAEGLLLVLLGYGTKLSHYLLTNDKRYRFMFRFGIITDTLDKTGTTINQQKVQLEQKHIKQVLENNLGKLSLPVPLVSAVKIKGKKLYEYKRKSQSVTPPTREMTFYNLNIKNITTHHCHTDNNPTVEVELSCSKGSYIRSWVSFIGEEMGTGACLEELMRLHSTPFNIEKALTLQEVEKRLNREEINSETIAEKLYPAFIPFPKALPHIESVCVARQDERQLRQGQISKSIKLALQDKQKEVNRSKETQTIRAMNHNNKQMLALLKLQPFLSPRFLRVFPSGLS